MRGALGGLRDVHSQNEERDIRSQESGKKWVEKWRLSVPVFPHFLSLDTVFVPILLKSVPILVTFPPNFVEIGQFFLTFCEIGQSLFFIFSRIAHPQCPISKKMWWETSNLKKNARKLWSDCGGQAPPLAVRPKQRCVSLALSLAMCECVTHLLGACSSQEDHCLRE